MQKPVEWEIPDEVLKGTTEDSDRLAFSRYFKPLALTGLGANPDPTQIDTLRRLLGSELGHMFLDRTRIRPAGFALGEHLQSLSLAPGEELVLEQKTFSKREVSFEEQSEQERQLDLELSSTLSTELQEGLERENSRTVQTGTQIGGSAGVEVSSGGSDGAAAGPGATAAPMPVDLGLEIKADASYSQNVTDASRQASRRSVKDSASASSKVAAKYRAMHKTVFRVATEDRFELTSKRVVKNPSRLGPLDLHYFKVMRRIRLVQERYGVRLCWAPTVKDPGFDIRERVRAARERFMAQAENVPTPPKPQLETGDEPDKVEQSAQVAADQWGAMWDMSADYDVPIDIPAGYIWDGDTEKVKALTQVWDEGVDRRWGWYVAGDPWVSDGRLFVRIHVGCDWKWPVGRRGDIFMQAKANFVAKPDAEEYKRWQAAVAKWEAEVAALKEGPRRRAAAQADEWERATMAGLDPIAELMNRVVRARFPGAVTDEPWELGLWEQVFDWRSAGYFLYPSWWAGEAAREPLRAPDDFLNASWAKLYLPVKVGYERVALRWIVGEVVGDELEPELEEAFARIEADIAAYRQSSFGSADELDVAADGEPNLKDTFLVLGRWEELLPTDGTHVEVIHGATSALDDLSKLDLEDARRLLRARAAGEEQDVELKKKAVAEFTKKGLTNVEVRIATEEAGSNGRTE